VAGHPEFEFPSVPTTAAMPADADNDDCCYDHYHQCDSGHGANKHSALRPSPAEA
jgi:hypothetical protein